MAEFSEFEKKLKDLLDEFEWREYCKTGMKHLNGGYAIAQYKNFEDDYIYFHLDWGWIDGDENVNHNESYKIAAGDLMTDETAKEKIKYIQDGDTPS